MFYKEKVPFNNVLIHPKFLRDYTILTRLYSVATSSVTTGNKSREIEFLGKLEKVPARPGEVEFGYGERKDAQLG